MTITKSCERDFTDWSAESSGKVDLNISNYLWSNTGNGVEMVPINENTTESTKRKKDADQDEKPIPPPRKKKQKHFGDIKVDAREKYGNNARFPIVDTNRGG